MRSLSIENLFYSAVHLSKLSLVLLLFFSYHQNLIAEEKEAGMQQKNTCALLPGSQNPILVKDATPNKKVAVLTGIIKDKDVLKSGECAGTEVGLNPHRKIITLIMNEKGEKRGDIYIPPTVAKTGSMQMVDLSSCRAGEIIEVKYVDSKPEEGCIYSFPEDNSPIIYSGPVSATGNVFHSEPFCASTLNISGDVTVYVYNGSARVVQNLVREFGVQGDGCYSGYRDSSGSVFDIDVEDIEGSQSIEGELKIEDDSYTWKLVGDGENLTGSFVNDHHYCCGRGNHTGTASGEVTLSRQKQGE